MKSNDVSLCSEVYKSDVERIYYWLNDEEIISFLNEDKNVKRNLLHIINSVNMPILTHLFNNNCRFFIIKDTYQSVGFLRLIPKTEKAEVVIVVGEKELWGYGIGHNAMIEALKVAFFEMRYSTVVAKIKKSNLRSHNLFKKIGFKKIKELETEIEYHINFESFLKKIKAA
ncbi:MAG: GNAT family N-acetyltransferase [Clostridiales bacterium]|nr:GNAT family N-acetyltransferase [Clostridiales bacterium]